MLAAQAFARQVPSLLTSRARCSRNISTQSVAHLLQCKPVEGEPQSCSVTGWVRTARLQKSYNFLSVNDGSTPQNIQVVWKATDDVVSPASDLKNLTNGCAVTIDGNLCASPKPAQPVELQATSVRVVGRSDAEAYPLQKKVRCQQHSLLLRD